MNIFFDCEFTGLHQHTTLISIGCVTENDAVFYGECTDYDNTQVDKWIKKHVIKNLMLGKDERTLPCSVMEYKAHGDRDEVSRHLFDWLLAHAKFDLAENENIDFWGDCLAFDWILLTELLGGALKLPEWISYIPFDICTLMKLKGVDPDVSREDFIGLPKLKELAATYNVMNPKPRNKHNALWDARVIKACYEKLMELSQ